MDETTALARLAAVRRALIPSLVVALVAVTLVSAAVGAYDIPVGDVVDSVLNRIGLGEPLDETAEAVLWQVRMPRIVLGLLVGACLGVAGALMQGTFANPLAEPGIIGVSSGAAVGASLVIVLGLGSFSVPLAAFAGGLLTTGIVYLMAREGGRTEVVTLVLTGIAINAFTGALVGLLTYLSDDEELRALTFWTLGSLASATWDDVKVVAPLAIVGLLLAPLFSRRLDLLGLGEASARHLGIDVERLRIMVIALVAVLTAAAVASAGVITFVGLVVPHLVRMVAGPGHRLLVPASALLGAVVLVLADLAARTLAAPAEMPLGVLTALVGSPAFFWLIRRTRARQGGWA
jgi:iron complex transport system permease protein